MSLPVRSSSGGFVAQRRCLVTSLSGYPPLRPLTIDPNTVLTAANCGRFDKILSNFGQMVLT
jgi:hypothetical protein